QLLTSGWKAEFGRGSGGVVNVVTRGGSDAWRGALSLFQRDSRLDSSNVPGADAPFLRRRDYGANAGGPLRRGRAFAFASFERVEEERQLNFAFPAGTPAALREFERRFDRPTRERRSLAFVRLDGHAGAHHLQQNFAWTNELRRDFLPLSQATDLPSTRRDSSARSLSFGLADTVLLGRGAGILTARAQVRREPASAGPSHPEAGPATQLELFSDAPGRSFFGDQGRFSFGASHGSSHVRQRYESAEAQLALYRARHQWKFGGGHTRMRADGEEAALLFNQLFATARDLAEFGPAAAGFFSLRTRGGATPADNLFRLRNGYTGLFAQDDVRVRKGLTLNLGVRWDYDSRFPSRRDFAPRLGLALALGPRTVVRAGWGAFYDRFRLGLARDVPEFGGARASNVQPVSYPRLFYGVPTIAPVVFGLCLSPTQTSAQVAASAAKCPLGPMPLRGVDTLNLLVAQGHAPIPANVPVSMNNVTALSGLSPQEFADRASAAVGRPAGFFFWGPFGALTHAGSPVTAFPVTLDPSFRTPHTRGLHVGVEHRFARGLTVEAAYFQRRIRDLVGMRLTNIPFEARLPGQERRFDPPSTQQEVRGLGSWFGGRYDALSLGVGGCAGRLTFGGSYTYARATDNARCSSLTTGLVMCAPSDSFVGVVPVVTDPSTGQSNAASSFVASNGNPVPRAGTFHNGPDFDRGPSDLALDHTLAGYALVRLPGRFDLGAIFRFQSGFHFSRQAEVPVDVDGDLNFNTVDHAAGRNAFTAPPLANVDVRVARAFAVGERVRVTALVEFFNLFDRRNPAAVETAEGRPVAFGRPVQLLPGREGQLGLRIQF
ncbi:MAG TPA: TonB-dependent receptor, partial [Pyrinomonadaceae bacterium]